MKFDPNKHHRRSIRLEGYDYSQPGAYFITIVTYRRESLFGEVVNGEMVLNKLGRVLDSIWYDLPSHYANIALDAFCIMPNHVHCVLVLNQDDTGVDHPLSEIIRGFKSLSAKRINSLRKMPGMPVWHRNYYEHIIRDEEDYRRIQRYISRNPDNWSDDNLL